jgi:flagellar assembly protein FliH
MSSSSERLVHRTQVLRGADIRPMPALTDLDSLTGPGRSAVDPAVVAEAQARGYEDGRADGYADGYAAGRSEALAAAASAEEASGEAVEAALAALAAVGGDLSARHREVVAGLEAVLVDGAMELATAIVGRDLELALAPGRDALARALRLAEGTDAVFVRMHPDDVATLGEHADLAPGRDLTVVADPAVSRGGCVVDVGDGRVDARLDAALERVREVLAS